MKNVNSLAYDSANELLWWTDDQKNTVEVLSMMDGRFHNTIIAAERNSPSSLTIDPNHGQIYWSEGYEAPKVFSSKMNLEEIEEILQGQHSNPNALFYSATTEQLHVADGTGRDQRTLDRYRTALIHMSDLGQKYPYDQSMDPGKSIDNIVI